MKLVDKDAVVAEIERIKLIIGNPFCLNNIAKASWVARKDICEDILSFLDTLEVKEENRGRELSYEDYVGFFGEHPDFPDDWGFDEAWVFAKHFFELGLKVRNLKYGKDNSMTDKVQKIKDWISKEQDGLMDAQGNFEYSEHEGAYHILCNLDTYIDSMQKEPVSEGLDDAAFDYAESCKYDGGEKLLCAEHFKAGAKWQKEQMMAKAIDAHCFGFQGAALFSFRLPADNYLVGSEVKVIVIKED